jgi:hypothetical protein
MALPTIGQKQTIRSAAILTTSYVATNSIETEEANKVFLFVDFTIGNLTSAEIQVEFSPDGTNWYVDQEFGTKSLTATGKYVYPINVKGIQMRAEVKGTGTTTGSSMAVDAQVYIGI